MSTWHAWGSLTSLTLNSTARHMEKGSGAYAILGLCAISRLCRDQSEVCESGKMLSTAAESSSLTGVKVHKKKSRN